MTKTTQSASEIVAAYDKLSAAYDKAAAAYEKLTAEQIWKARAKNLQSGGTQWKTNKKCKADVQTKIVTNRQIYRVTATVACRRIGTSISIGLTSL